MGSKYSKYFKKYSQKHDPFNKNGNTKHILSSTMQHFQNIICNLIRHKKSVISIAAIIPKAVFVSSNQAANQTMVQLRAQVRINKSWVITL